MVLPLFSTQFTLPIVTQRLIRLRKILRFIVALLVLEAVLLFLIADIMKGITDLMIAFVGFMSTRTLRPPVAVCLCFLSALNFGPKMALCMREFKICFTKEGFDLSVLARLEHSTEFVAGYTLFANTLDPFAVLLCGLCSYMLYVEMLLSARNAMPLGLAEPFAISPPGSSGHDVIVADVHSNRYQQPFTGRAYVLD